MIGAIVGGAANLIGGAGGISGLAKGLGGLFSGGGGIGKMLGGLLGGKADAGGGSQPVTQFFGDIKNMLSQLIQGQGGGGGGQPMSSPATSGSQPNCCAGLGHYGNDTKIGGRGSDRLDGGAGHDALYGGKGADSLNGGSGDDYLSGGRGGDVLRGGSGTNTMMGGSGNDIYVIEHGSRNEITERKGHDTLVLDGNREDYNVSRRGNDMIIESRDGQTEVIIRNQHGGPDIENFQFTGKPLPSSDCAGSGHACTPPPHDIICGEPDNDGMHGGWRGDDLMMCGHDRPRAFDRN